MSIVVDNGSNGSNVRFGPVRAACLSCKWSVGLAFVAIGSIFMAIAGDMFLIDIEMAWRAGWTVRLATWLVSSTLPVVLTLIIRDYLRSRRQRSLRYRVSWVGMIATGVGVLELILAMALFWVMGAL
jgi:hypothetical protein